MNLLRVSGRSELSGVNCCGSHQLLQKRVRDHKNNKTSKSSTVKTKQLQHTTGPRPVPRRIYINRVLQRCEFYSAVEPLKLKKEYETTVIPRSHDTGMSLRIGMKISIWYNDRGELAPARIAPGWEFVLVSCKRTQSHNNPLPLELTGGGRQLSKDEQRIFEDDSTECKRHSICSLPSPYIFTR